MTGIQEFSILVAVTIGVVQALKMGFEIPTKFLPLTALVVGIGATLLANQADLLNVTNVKGFENLMGAIVGLSAAGLFDQKLLFNKKEDLDFDADEEE